MTRILDGFRSYEGGNRPKFTTWPDATIGRRRLLTGLGAVAAAGLAGGLSACGSSGHGQSGQSGGEGRHDAAATPSAPARPGAASSAPPLDEAALRKKIASLLVVGFRGATADPDSWIMRAIREQGLGGVILFDRDQQTGKRRNIISPPQVTALVRTLRQHAPGGRLIVAIDQEGGKISRLNPGDGFPAVASQARIGAINRAATTRAWARDLVRPLTEVGVTLNFAPVVDLDVNPSSPAVGGLGRSFSADPDVVVANAAEEIRVHRAAGVRTVLKHFPGLGSATGNTDFGVVDVSKTWRPVELEPFAKLIDAREADCVMAAHLLNHQLDPNHPASLSRLVVHDLLRGKLGWSGPVASDDMQAVAITARYGKAEAVTLAVDAGVDMLVFGNQAVYDEKVVTETVDTIVGLVRGGRVRVEAIDASVARVDALRPPR